jgi:hypothetical protein
MSARVSQTYHDYAAAVGHLAAALLPPAGLALGPVGVLR